MTEEYTAVEGATHKPRLKTLPPKGPVGISSQWKTITELPSKFLPYPKGVKIQYCPYNWDSMTDLSDGGLSTVENIRLTMENIRCEGMDKSDITHMDYFFLAVMIKIDSLGSDSIQIVFNYLGTSRTAIIDPTSLDFQDLDVPALPAVVKYPGGLELQLSPPTIAAYLEIVELDLLGDEKWGIAYMVQNMSPADAHKILKTTTGLQLQAIAEINLLFDHGLKEVAVSVPESVPNPKWDVNGKSEQTDKSGKFISPMLVQDTEVMIKITDPSILIMPFHKQQNPFGDVLSFGT